MINHEFQRFYLKGGNIMFYEKKIFQNSASGAINSTPSVADVS